MMTEQAAEPPGRAGLRQPHRWRRRIVATGAMLLLLLTPVGWSLGQAMTAPGTDSMSARVAEWARIHHAGWLVTWLERRAYHPPQVGGSLRSTSPLAMGAASAPTIHRVPQLPPPITPLASPPLPGEGRWHVLDSVHGSPAIAAAYVRPDAVHTSYTSAVVWIDPRLVRAVFHPGYQEPGGGPWPATDELTGTARNGLLAAFNSAFRLQDSRGGFYGYGKTLSPLRNGQASMVLYRNGTMTVGAWGRDVTMTSQVSVVRQNLALIVDHGHAVRGLASNVNNRWGATLGNAYYVWRSGIGVTNQGDIVFVIGDALSAPSLAHLLVRAGAVRGMELDINPEWTSFILYRSPAGRTIERNLLSGMQQPPRRYDVPSSRDFVALYAR